MDLVKDLPPEQEPEYENLATVFEGDSDSAALARAAVEGSGIESWIQDEEVHGLFPSLGLCKVLVREEDEESALKALEIPDEKDTPGNQGNDSKRTRRKDETLTKSHPDKESR